MSDLDWIAAARRLGLSPRQAEIIRGIIVDELSNKEIARRLGIHCRTVDKQVERMFRKLGVHNRTAAATKVVSVLWTLSETAKTATARV